MSIIQKLRYNKLKKLVDQINNQTSLNIIIHKPSKKKTLKPQKYSLIINADHVLIVKPTISNDNLVANILTQLKNIQSKYEQKINVEAITGREYARYEVRLDQIINLIAEFEEFRYRNNL